MYLRLDVTGVGRQLWGHCPVICKAGLRTLLTKWTALHFANTYSFWPLADISLRERREKCLITCGKG